MLNYTIKTYIEQLSGEHISIERKTLLFEIAEKIKSNLSEGKEVKLNFICTHNSRRSQFSQVWAHTFFNYFNIKNITCFSGGTEATKLNKTVLTTLSNIGFEVLETPQSDNPKYKLSYGNSEVEFLTLFSKVYNEAGNPKKNYLALMTCSDADENCPIVLGADSRYALIYDDPKVADNTPEEERIYAERCAQIASELYFLATSIKKED